MRGKFLYFFCFLPFFLSAQSQDLPSEKKKDVETFSRFGGYERGLSSKNEFLKQHFLSMQFFTPLKSHPEKAVSSFRYGLIFSSWFDDKVQDMIGRWSLRGRLSWIHNKKISEIKKHYSSFIHPTPLLADVDLSWEMTYFPYITPFVSFGVSQLNPLKKQALSGYLQLPAPAKNRLFVVSMGLLISFDLFDASFSRRINHEYGIADMGLSVEYQRWIPFPKFRWSKSIEKKFFFGLFFSF